jgi:hypothetical protein
MQSQDILETYHYELASIVANIKIKREFKANKHPASTLRNEDAAFADIAV